MKILRALNPFRRRASVHRLAVPLSLLVLSFAQSGVAWQVPIEYSRSRFIVATITVDDHRYRALIDTGGANGVEISQTLADRLGLKLEYGSASLSRYGVAARHVKVARVRRFDLGDFSAQDQPVEVVSGDIEKISTQLRMPVDAIIGWGFLSNYFLSIDYRAGMMKFGDMPYDATDSKVTLAFVSAHGNGPVVAGRLDGKPIHFLVDTGAPRSTIDADSEARSIGPILKRVGLGEMATPLAVRPRDLTALKDIGAQAVLGNDFLAGWILIFDPAKKALSLVAR